MGLKEDLIFFAQAVRIATIQLRIKMKRYWKGFLLGAGMGGLAAGITTFLMGKFVGNIVYNSIAIPYAVFAAVGLGVSYIYPQIVMEFTKIRPEEKIKLILAKNKISLPLAMSLTLILEYLVPFCAWIIPIVIYYHVSPVVLIEAYVIGSVCLLPSMGALGLLLTAISTYIRGQDYWKVQGIMFSALSVIVPGSFGISAYGPARRVAKFIPSVAVVEGVRRFIFGIPGAKEFVLYGVISGIICLWISIEILSKTIHIARRKGWIMLE